MYSSNAFKVKLPIIEGQSKHGRPISAVLPPCVSLSRCLEPPISTITTHLTFPMKEVLEVTWLQNGRLKSAGASFK